VPHQQLNLLEKLKNTSSVQALIKEGELVEKIEAGECGIVVLTASSFYAESGGQVGDSGIFSLLGHFHFKARHING
jgi:alanyl-tRNA synthetase